MWFVTAGTPLIWPAIPAFFVSPFYLVAQCSAAWPRGEVPFLGATLYGSITRSPMLPSVDILRRFLELVPVLLTQGKICLRYARITLRTIDFFTTLQRSRRNGFHKTRGRGYFFREWASWTLKRNEGFRQRWAWFFLWGGGGFLKHLWLQGI